METSHFSNRLRSRPLIALTFYSSTLIRLVDTIKPKNIIKLEQKQHFLRLVNKCSFISVVRTRLKCSTWLSKLLLYTSISTKYTTTNFPIETHKKWFINLIKVLGALVKPKGITNHSYWCVRNPQAYGIVVSNKLRYCPIEITNWILKY